MEKRLFFKDVERRKDDDRTLKPEIESFLENKEMYNLPGFSDITEEDIRRYIESNRKLCEELPDIIQKSFKRGYWKDNVSIATTIPYVLESQQKPLQEQCLKLCQKYFKKDNDRSVREGALSMIPYIPIKKRTAFVQKSLRDKNTFICRKGAEMISYALWSEQYFLRERCLKIFQKNFRDKHPLVRGDAVAMIPYAPAEKRAGLVQRAYEGEQGIFVLIEIIKTISSVPKEERAGLIQMLLKNKSPLIREKTIQIIPSASEAKIQALFQEALLDKDHSNHELAKRMIRGILREEKTEIEVQQIKEREEELKNNPLIQELAGRSSLYNKNDKKFFRKNFPKSYSRITLLGKIPGQSEKSLRQRVIIRHIEAAPYFLWKKAYEAHKYWRERGFDYVPVEPIIRVSHHKPIFNNVEVFTRVLNGPSARSWGNIHGPYRIEIEEQIRKIKRGLEELGVDHRHLHEGNFVLLFSKKEDGTPNLSHPPRVYVIDFDMARSKQELGE